ncbi:hypothetical protein [Variovorax sp. ZT4R33]|uniref:hypothetical protein n=1 Tax=Variovorax sp. ZT4R33 TaxID=3443743 RepID=UPI003F48F0C2
MTLFKRWLVIKLCLLMVLPLQAWPQALPATQPDRVGRAISGTLQDGMRSRGFAANDPRFGNTLVRATPQLAAVAGGTAGAITVGAVTAPAWATVAIGLVVGAVITYAVNLALNGLVNWLFRSDGKIDESGAPLTVPTSTAMTAGDAYWKVSFHSVGVNIDLAGGDGEALARQGHYEYLSQTGQNTQTAPNCSASATQAVCGIIYANKQSSGAPASCPAGSMFKNGVCGPYTFASPAAIPSKTSLPLQQAVNDIPAADLNKPLNPAIVAAMANQAWQQAASQPGYDGLPYPQSNPITAPEAATWANANPTYAPTVGDFVSPNPTTTARPQPWALPQNPTATVTSPATTPNANTTNPASQNPQENLGPDPGIGAPTLEPTPTAQQIMQPILDLAPGLRHFQPTSHTGTCPRPTFDLVGRTLTLEAHCTLIDANKPIMQAAMAFAWAALALFVILSA